MYICLFIFIRPGAVCCPEVYRDVPGMMMMMDDDDEHGDAESRNVVPACLFETSELEWSS